MDLLLRTVLLNVVTWMFGTTRSFASGWPCALVYRKRSQYVHIHGVYRLQSIVEEVCTIRRPVNDNDLATMESVLYNVHDAGCDAYRH
jgi:hypothetical protein